MPATNGRAGASAGVASCDRAGPVPGRTPPRMLGSAALHRGGAPGFGIGRDGRLRGSRSATGHFSGVTLKRTSANKRRGILSAVPRDGASVRRGAPASVSAVAAALSAVCPQFAGYRCAALTAVEVLCPQSAVAFARVGQCAAGARRGDRWSISGGIGCRGSGVAALAGPSLGSPLAGHSRARFPRVCRTWHGVVTCRH